MNRFVVLAVLASAPVWAEVDYSRCTGFGSAFPIGVTVGSDNQITVSSPATQKSVRTEGNKTTYEVQQPTSFGTAASTVRFVVERDAQGRISSVSTGQPQPTAAQVNQYRRNTIANMARMQVPNSGDGTLVYNRTTGRTETVNLDRLTPEQLRSWGITDVSPQQLRDMRGQWHKDMRTQRRLQSVYERMYADMPVNMFLGTKTSFSFQDNACMISSSSFLNYNSQSNSVIESQTFDAARCPDVQALAQRHSETIQQCQLTGGFGNRNLSGMDRLNQDMQEKGLSYGFGGMGGGISSGWPGYNPTSVQPGAASLRDSEVNGGFGMYGAFGMYGFGMGGYGMSGYGMGMGLGMNPAQNLQSMQMMCNYYGNRPAGQGGNAGGSGAASEDTSSSLGFGF